MSKPSDSKPWYKLKKTWILIGVPVALFLLVFFGLHPVVVWKTKKTLEIFEGFTSTFDDAKLQPTRLNYALLGLKIVKESAGGQSEPFFSADKIELSVYWKELVHGHIVGRIEIENPQVHLIAAKAKESQQADPEIPDLSEKLADAMPLVIDRVQVRQAQIFFVDKTVKEFPRLRLHGMDVTIENLATRAALARGEPTTIAMSATLQKNAEVSAFITADPLAKGLFFAGRFEVKKLDMVELKDLISSESGVMLSRGNLDLFAEFDCRSGKLSGGIKPVLKDAKVVQGKPGVTNLLKAVLADTAVKIFSDRVQGRDAVATVIPIGGDINKPDIQLWPTILGVIRNAFVEGVTESFQRLPPPEADSHHNPITQAVRGLDKGRTGPEAQPTEVNQK